MKKAVILAVIIGAAAILAPILILHDLTIYWRAANAFVRGLDPYALPNHLNYLTGELGGVEYSDEPLKMWGPPHVFAVIFPLGYFGISSAKVVYVFLFLLALLWSVSKCTKLFRARSQEETLAPWLFQFFLILPTGWAIDVLIWGGMSWISLAGLVLFLSLAENKALFRAGLSLFLFLLKPQQLAFVMLGILVWGLRGRHVRLFQGWAISWSIAIIFTLIINPIPWSTFFSLDYTVPYRSQPYGSGLLHYFGLGSAPRLLLAGWILAGGIYLFWLLIKQRELKAVVGVGVAFSIISCPYVWPHDFVVLAPFFGYLTFLAYESAGLYRHLIREGLLLAQLTAFLGCLEEPSPSRFLICIPPLVLLLTAVLLNPGRSGLPSETTVCCSGRGDSLRG